MKKHSDVKSGFIILRNLLGVLLCLVGLSLAALTMAANPSSKSNSSTKKSDFHPIHPASGPTSPAAGPAPTSGTLSVNNPTLTYTDPVGPVPNATGEGIGFSKPTCAANGVDCSNYTVTLDPSIFTA